MPRPQLEFIDRHVHVVFSNGSITGVLESVGDDGSLFLRQGHTAIWVPLGQVRYVTLVEEPPTPREPEEPLT